MSHPRHIECARRCGLFVAADGPTICGSCLASDAARAETERRRLAEEARLDKTERAVGPHVVRTRGFGLYVAVAASSDPNGRLMMRSEAEAVAKAILAAVAHLDGLKSPHIDERRAGAAKPPSALGEGT